MTDPNNPVVELGIMGRVGVGARERNDRDRRDGGVVADLLLTRKKMHLCIFVQSCLSHSAELPRVQGEQGVRAKRTNCEGVLGTSFLNALITIIACALVGAGRAERTACRPER